MEFIIVAKAISCLLLAVNSIQFALLQDQTNRNKQSVSTPCVNSVHAIKYSRQELYNLRTDLKECYCE